MNGGCDYNGALATCYNLYCPKHGIPRPSEVRDGEANERISRIEIMLAELVRLQYDQLAIMKAVSESHYAVAPYISKPKYMKVTK